MWFSNISFVYNVSRQLFTYDYFIFITQLCFQGMLKKLKVILCFSYSCIIQPLSHLVAAFPS